ncbi:MAG TPA: cytochrome c oxidase subunit 3 [Mycobacteriales bacterium]|nr:cytochrome c oxidase subunit 3 [Mycobacteriales bacterium]
MAAETSTASRADGRTLPGDINMWVFVLGDMVFFGAYCVIFMFYRTREQDMFLQSQRHLSLATGVINTLFLLTSSRFVALAVQAVRDGKHERATRLVGVGGLFGIAFVALKIHEWYVLSHHGFALSTNDFFMFYFALTAIHVFHVLLGMFVLGLVVRELRRDDLQRTWVVEAGATYWHMVDLIWVLLFAILYVMR